MTKLRFKPRKICRVNRSYSVTLPVFWAESMKLEFGDMLDLELGPDNELILKPHREACHD